MVDQLATKAEPGLMAMPSGRFFGWVIGGTLPTGIAADWLVSAWDQNSVLRYGMPAMAAIEEAAAAWLLDLFGLPAGADVGFVTGATMANFTALAAARQSVLATAGWDVNRDGLSGAPKIHVLVGQERHETLDLALRYLGLGQPTAVAVDAQGRIRPDALADALAALPAGAPVVVCLQAGNIHSGAFDPLPPASDWPGNEERGCTSTGHSVSGQPQAPGYATWSRPGGCGLLGHRCAQDPERPVRLRRRDRRRCRRTAYGVPGALQLSDRRHQRAG